MKRFTTAILLLFATMAATAQGDILRLHFAMQSANYGEAEPFGLDGEEDPDILATTMNVICDETGIMIELSIPNAQPYYTIFREDDKLSITMEDGSTVEFPISKEEGVIHKTKTTSSLFGLLNTDTYLTKVYFHIPNWEEFIDKNVKVIKYSAEGNVVSYAFQNERKKADFNNILKEAGKKAMVEYQKIVQKVCK